MTVPALRNIEGIITNIQTQQKDLSNNVHEIQEWLKVQLLSLMDAVKEMKSAKIYPNSVPQLYEQISQKHEKIETIQTQCIDKMDKYLDEICRLNATIQEKDKEILKLKLTCSNASEVIRRPVVDTCIQTVPQVSVENTCTYANHLHEKGIVSNKVKNDTTASINQANIEQNTTEKGEKQNDKDKSLQVCGVDATGLK